MPAVTARPVPAPGRARRTRVLRSTVATALLVVVSLIALLGVGLPMLLGLQNYVVTTGSMRPALEPGHLIGVRQTPIEEVHVGDIVTFQIVSGRPETATHRVVGVTSGVEGERSLITQGDANDVPDAEPVTEVQLRGVVVYAVPVLGHLAAWATPAVKSVLVSLLGAGVVLYGTVLVARGLRRPRAAARRALAASVSVVVFGAIAWSPVGATAATAAAPGTEGTASPIELSLDGDQWSTETELLLFDGSDVLVPGDVLERSLWLRNGSDDPAESSVVARWIPVDPDHPAHRSLAGDLRVTIGHETLAPGQEWHGVELRPGEMREILVTAELPLGATSHDSRAASASLVIDVALSRSAPPEPGSGQEPPREGGTLPVTGSSLVLLLLVVAGIAGGLELTRRGRRDQRA